MIDCYQYGCLVVKCFPFFIDIFLPLLYVILSKVILFYHVLSSSLYFNSLLTRLSHWCAYPDFSSRSFSPPPLTFFPSPFPISYLLPLLLTISTHSSFLFCAFFFSLSSSFFSSLLSILLSPSFSIYSPFPFLLLCHPFLHSMKNLPIFYWILPCLLTYLFFYFFISSIVYVVNSLFR